MLLATLAHADTLVLVPRNAPLCSGPGSATCVSVDAPADPSREWRDATTWHLVSKKDGWVEVEGQAGEATGCVPSASAPAAVRIHGWVKQELLVVATTRAVEVSGEGASVKLPAGIPTGPHGDGQLVPAVAPPFDGLLRIPTDALGTEFALADWTASVPGFVDISRGTAPVRLGDGGRGMLSGKGLHGALDGQGTVTVASGCVAAVAPEAAGNGVVVGEAVPSLAAPVPTPGTKLPAGTALFFTDGKPAGTTLAAIDPADDVEKKGKLVCWDLPTTATVKKSVHLCVAKTALPG